MTMTRLGKLAPNGAIYYANEDINEVRQFLRDAGLDIHKDRPVWMGWHSRDNSLHGAIYFDNHRYVGSYRKGE